MIVGLAQWPFSACGEYIPNNTIILASDSDDESYLHVQKIHTTIRPQQRFLRRGAEWVGDEATWEGEAYQLQTTYLVGWSIEVHYGDEAVPRWKKSTTTGNEYAVFVGKHVPTGLTIPINYATRGEPGCMLSRKFDPEPDKPSFPDSDWHSRDWDFVESRMTEILQSHGINKPWADHSRRKLVGTLGNRIKTARLTGDSVETNLHPADALADKRMYCTGAANTLVAMCSVLKIPARLMVTADHAFVEIQNDDGRWLYVENQPDTFMYLRGNGIPFDPKTQYGKAREWAKQQDFDAVFDGGAIDLMSDPAKFRLGEMPGLGWFYNWSCPQVYDKIGAATGKDLCARPQALHDWVFNLYTGYGKYEDDYMHRRGMFMAERLNSVYELAALYSPRRDDLPYVCGRRGGDDNVMFLTPFRDSYYSSWENNTRVESGARSGVRQQFTLSGRKGIRSVDAVILLGPDDHVEHTIPADGGDWYYEVNGKRFPLNQHGGFRPVKNYEKTGMTAHRFKIPIDALKWLR